MYINSLDDSERNRRFFYDLGTDRGIVSSKYEGLERINLYPANVENMVSS